MVILKAEVFQNVYARVISESVFLINPEVDTWLIDRVMIQSWTHAINGTDVIIWS